MRAQPGAVALAGFLVGTVAMLIVPLPTPLLDLCIAANLGLSVLVLLVAMSAREPLELSTFPTLLLLATLYRLALNVSSVRSILLHADAGRVIHAFGAFVVRGDYLVGGAVFLILTLVQYVVIARGAERVAEVAARFQLDALPGKQLAIDAELRSGAITTIEAQEQRAAIGREAQLYGALDGAMRFVKGDAVASIAILGVSLVGGLVIGVLRRGMTLREAAQVFTLLTVGDGLVSQLPALLLSAAAGLVVTRVASDRGQGALERDLRRQLGHPEALVMAGAFLCALGLLPGLPLFPFLLAGATLIAGAALVGRRQIDRADGDARAALPLLEVAVDPHLELGIPGLRARVAQVGRALEAEIGLPLPPIAVTVDARLPSCRYELRLRGVPLAAGELPHGRLLADVGPARLPAGLDADPGDHPSSGALAAWVPIGARGQLAGSGIRLYEAEDYLALRLDTAVRAAATELVGLEETQRLIDGLAKEAPALVKEVIPQRLELVALAEVLRRLVAEGVSIGDLRQVLEIIARQKDGERDPAALTERVRAGMRRRISHTHARNRRLDALLLDGDAEEAVRGALRPGRYGSRLSLEPELHDALLGAVKRELEGQADAVILTSSELRPHVRRLIADDHPRLPVLSYDELLSDVQVDRVGTIRLG
jgi:type III secretory pathway component EscV